MQLETKRSAVHSSAFEMFMSHWCILLAINNNIPCNYTFIKPDAKQKVGQQTWSLENSIKLDCQPLTRCLS